MAIVLAIGLLCGLWVFIAPLVGLIGWAGFAGCTTFFSVGTGGVKALRKTMLCNITGVACGMLIIQLSNVSGIPNGAAIFSGLVAALMTLLGIKVLPINYTPGIFMGATVTFAANGNWIILLLSLLSGAILGFLCEQLGNVFSKWGLYFSAKQGKEADEKVVS